MTEILEPIEVEVEKYTEDDYDDMLDEIYPPFSIAGLSGFITSRTLKELDPIAYRCGFSDYQEYETKYECPICGEQFDDYDDAKWHCQDELEDEED